MNLQQQIQLWRERIATQVYYPRKFPDESILGLQKIIAFLWWRRVGKSSMMISLIQNYIKKWDVLLEQVVFLDFSAIDVKWVDLEQWYIDNRASGLFFVLDEVQELPDFERVVTFLYNQWCRVYISGSNAEMLGQDIATKLRGRVIDVQVDVLDFEEFLSFKWFEQGWSLSQIDQYFDEYLQWWWYPEIVLSQTQIAKKAIIQSYFDILVYKDLIDRYSIRNSEVLIKLMRSLIQSHTKMINVSKIKNMYTSQWYTVKKSTLLDYIHYLKSTFFVAMVWKFYSKSYFDKVYLIDNAYMNLFSDSPNYGQAFENVIYKYLRKQVYDLGYIENGYAVDFTDGTSNRQVCYELNENNYDRELKFQKSDKENILIYKKDLVEIGDVKKIRYNELLLNWVLLKKDSI